MASLSEIRRVVCRHDWQCLAEWPRALDGLADLTDGEIDRLVRSDRQMETLSARNKSLLAAEGQTLASRIVLQAVCLLSSGGKQIFALFLPHLRH